MAIMSLCIDVEAMAILLMCLDVRTMAILFLCLVLEAKIMTISCSCVLIPKLLTYNKGSFFHR